LGLFKTFIAQFKDFTAYLRFLRAICAFYAQFAAYFRVFACFSDNFWEFAPICQNLRRRGGQFGLFAAYSAILFLY